MLIKTLIVFVIVNVIPFSYGELPRIVTKSDSEIPENLLKVQKYQPTWDSLDSRPLPKWYDNAKVGIFIHWGVYSVPSFGSEWFWVNWRELKYPNYVNYMKNHYKPGFTYQEFAKDFTADLFNATEWADLFQKSGAKYVVLTSKHHDGFTLWPSTYSFSWNAVDVGPHRDIIDELSKAIRKRTDIRFGLYYSLFEWFNRMYLKDKQNSFMQREYSSFKMWPELTELINRYRPEVLWSDGDWDASEDYWKSKEFIAWLYNDSPVSETIVTNDRWGIGVLCKHGDFITCSDRYNPGVLQKHKWENAFTLDKTSWGHRESTNFSEYMTSQELIKEIVTTVSCNGNVLVNIGPTKSGTIEPIFSERLLDMGKWLRVNGEAIYETVPWVFQNDTMTPDVWFTASKSSPQYETIYAMVLKYPTNDNTIEFTALKNYVNDDVEVVLLGYKNNIQWKKTVNGVSVVFPNKQEIEYLNWAWTIKFTNWF